MPVRNLPISDVGPHARDVMLTSPDTVAAETTVADARGLLDNPRLRMLLVADGDHLVGAVSRERLEGESDGSLPLARLADPKSMRVGPDEPVDGVIERMERAETERLPVVDRDCRLLGLICFNRRKRHFCVDALS